MLRKKVHAYTAYFSIQRFNRDALFKSKIQTLFSLFAAQCWNLCRMNEKIKDHSKPSNTLEWIYKRNANFPISMEAKFAKIFIFYWPKRISRNNYRHVSNRYTCCGLSIIRDQRMMKYYANYFPHGAYDKTRVSRLPSSSRGDKLLLSQSQFSIEYSKNVVSFLAEFLIGTI